MNLNTGINENKVRDIAKGLSKLLAETYTLYLKRTNITGTLRDQCFKLYTMFETHYTALALAVDEIAERIRVMDVKAPGPYTEFAELSQVKKISSKEIQARLMIKNLLQDHEQVVRTAKEILPILEGANDEGTNSLFGAGIEFHEKTAWMLKVY